MGDTLYKRLNDYSSEDYYPFHMPGHKRRTGEAFDGVSPYAYDITEIDGFDNLHEPEGILKERMERVSSFYEAKKSYYLVNGSTCGILAAISACSGRRNKIIMARNSHKAAYNAVLLNELEAVYVYPDLIEEYGINGGVSPSKVEEALERERNEGSLDDICCVYITSPTYEGIVSDILSISKVCHSYGKPLVVDEAHGAHFSMHKDFPISALELNADIVIQSLHKTLPSLTQTALLHIGNNSLVDEREVERYLSIYQTSSPSYVLMASIDECLDGLMEDTFAPFERLKGQIYKLHKRMRQLTNIKLLGREIIGKDSVYDFDMSKLVIFPKSRQCNGHALYERLLEKYHLQLEMASLNYAIAMTSINDTDEGFDRLFLALDDIDREIRLYEQPMYKKHEAGRGINRGLGSGAGNLPTGMTDSQSGGFAGGFRLGRLSEAKVFSKICEAVREKKEYVALGKAEGRVSAEFVYLYPPGIPVIAPGEMYSREIIAYLTECMKNGLKVTGISGDDLKAAVTAESWSSLEFKRLSLYDLF